MLFETKDERKQSRCDKILHKAMRIPVDIHQTSKNFSVTIQPKMHAYWNLHIIYGYHLLTNHSLTL